jgi:ribosomal protein S6
MPTYDLSLVIKAALKRPQIVAAVKRMGDHIYNTGGYIRSLEFVGERDLPQRQRANDEWHNRGNFFVLRVDLATKDIGMVSDEAMRDSDVIRNDIVSITSPAVPVCTLEDERKPPTERPSVQTMLDIGRQKPMYSKIYKPNTGLGFYPFFK